MSLKSLIVLPIIIMGLVACSSNSTEDQLTIGIIQTASHSALDQAREGFIEEMRHLNNGKVHFVIQNAEGSLSQAQSIAESFHTHRKIQAIFAIGTPAVQAAARAEKNKPIFVAAVSDPESLGILTQNKNICGTSDRLDTDAQIDMIISTLPKVQTIALIYNPGEHNSQTMIEKMEQSIQKKGLKSVKLGIHSESEISHMIQAASRKGDAILMPADNLLVAAIALVAKEALNNRCPLFVSDNMSVEKGALMGMGVNYFQLGKETGSIANRIFSGEKPDVIGIIHPDHQSIFRNEETAKKLNIEIPQNMAGSHGK